MALQTFGEFHCCGSLDIFCDSLIKRSFLGLSTKWHLDENSMQMKQKYTSSYKAYILGLLSSQQVQLICFSVCAHYIAQAVFSV